MSGRRGLHWTRREALQAGLWGTAAWAAGCGDHVGAPVAGDIERVRGVASPAVGPATGRRLPGHDAFVLGVASGRCLDDAMLVWTRWRGPGRGRLEVWRADDETLAAVFPTASAASGGCFVHIRVEGLAPSTEYAYAWLVEDAGGEAVARSEIGTLRTPPAADSLSAVTFGATACTEVGVPFDAVARLGDRADLDAVILLGDTVYADDVEGREGFNRIWQDTFGTAAYRAVRAGRPLLAIWDDHEVENGFNPEDSTPGRIADGVGAFYDHMPLERYPAAPDRLWRRHRWGRTVEVFLLDARSERAPSTRDTDDEQLLGPEQMAWLEEGLRDSPAVFKLVVTGMPVGDIPVPFGDDRWPGYRRQRERLLSFIEETPVEGVVFLAGDVHMPWTGRVAAEGLGAGLLEVGAGCGAKALPTPLAALFAPPQYDWAGGVNNYAALRFDGEARTLTVTHHDGDDGLLHDITYTF